MTIRERIAEIIGDVLLRQQRECECAEGQAYVYCKSCHHLFHAICREGKKQICPICGDDQVQFSFREWRLYSAGGLVPRGCMFRDGIFYNSLGMPYSVDDLIKEGLEIGKVPWCSDKDARYYVACKLCELLGAIGTESMRETIARRERI